LWSASRGPILARVKLSIALVALLLLPSCLLGRNHVNQPLDASAYAALEPGVTTAAEVAERMGAPVDVVELGFGSAWRYEYVRSKRTGVFLLLVGLLNDDTQSDRAWLFFDDTGLLTHAAATFEAGEAAWEMPWSEDD